MMPLNSWNSRSLHAYRDTLRRDWRMRERKLRFVYINSYTLHNRQLQFVCVLLFSLLALVAPGFLASFHSHSRFSPSRVLRSIFARLLFLATGHSSSQPFWSSSVQKHRTALPVLFENDHKSKFGYFIGAISLFRSSWMQTHTQAHRTMTQFLIRVMSMSLSMMQCKYEAALLHLNDLEQPGKERKKLNGQS